MKARSANARAKLGTGSVALEAPQNAADGLICLVVQRGLTAQQWEYLATLEDFAATGKPITQAAVGQAAGCTPRSISRWRRDPKFLRAAAQVIRAHTHVDVELAHRANLRQVFMGSTKAYEALLRRLGQWDAMPPELAPTGGGPPGSAAGAQAIAQVHFHGLPQPPNAEQRASMQPPAGSSMILTAAGVLEGAGLKKDGK